VPDPRRADEIGIFSERRQDNFRLLEWDKAAAAANHGADAIKKQGRTLHHAATQDDYVGGEQIDEIGQPETQISKPLAPRPGKPEHPPAAPVRKYDWRLDARDADTQPEHWH
jgi:hypothetical protein